MTKFLLLDETRIEDSSPLLRLGEIFDNEVNIKCDEWLLSNLSHLSKNGDQLEEIRFSFFLYFALRATEKKKTLHDRGRTEKPYRDALARLEKLFESNYKELRSCVYNKDSLDFVNRHIHDINMSIETIETSIKFMSSTRQDTRIGNKELVIELLGKASIPEYRHDNIIRHFNSLLDEFEEELSSKSIELALEENSSQMSLPSLLKLFS